jgi:hypothetical protein
MKKFLKKRVKELKESMAPSWYLVIPLLALNENRGFGPYFF